MPEPSEPSSETQCARNTIKLTTPRVENITSKNYPYHYPGEDHSFSLDRFREATSIQFHRNEPLHTVFSLIGVDASLANAIRRILLAEIPTLAIEDVYVNQNTSIVHDEVLAARLGLVPLRGSKQGLRWMRWRRRRRLAGPSEGMGDDPGPSLDGVEDEGAVEYPSTDFNTVRMVLRAECKWKEGGQRKFWDEDETDPEVLYEGAHVYAKDLEFLPVGQQVGKFQDDPIRPVNPGILLDKLRPEHEIDLEVHANFGIGADHAKYSPVATASYRLLPTIDLKEPIRGAAAKRFQKCFPPGVIGVEKKDGNEEEEVVVKDTFRDTVTREVLRHDEFKDKVKLGRVRDHFIFSVESTGQWDGDELVEESIKVLREKCRRLQKCLSELREVE